MLNAQIKMYYYGTGGSAWVDRWLQAHQILVNWAEAQATSINRLTGTGWNVAHVGLNDIDAKSSYESTLFFYLVGGQQVYGWKSWDLTSLTQKWVGGTATNYGVVLWATNETTDGKDLRFYSSEAVAPNDVNRPYLNVIYSQQAKTVYFLKDHLGSVRATVQDTAGAPVRGYDDYDPWGFILAGRSLANSVLPVATRNRFTGKERDDEFGVNWDYFGARYYDAQIGRWMVRDPLAEKFPDVSPYNYVLNNPLKFFDPTGEFPYTFYVRAFAPFKSFGGGFHGDARSFSTSLEVTSRVAQTFTLDTDQQAVFDARTWSDPSYHPVLGSAVGKPAASFSALETTTNSLGNDVFSLNTSFAGPNPLVPGAPAIDVQSSFALTENLNTGLVTISAIITGDKFPATEAFVADANGNKVFIGAGAFRGNPFVSLPGTNTRSIINVDVRIRINSKGIFQKVIFNGKEYSLEEWNALIGNTDPDENK